VFIISTIYSNTSDIISLQPTDPLPSESELKGKYKVGSDLLAVLYLYDCLLEIVLKNGYASPDETAECISWVKEAFILSIAPEEEYKEHLNRLNKTLLIRTTLKGHGITVIDLFVLSGIKRNLFNGKYLEQFVNLKRWAIWIQRLLGIE